MENDKLNTPHGIDYQHDQYGEEALFKTTLKNLCELSEKDPKNPLIAGYEWILKKQDEIWATKKQFNP